MERRAERHYLLAHLLCNPPANVKVVWPPGIEKGDVRSLDLDRIGIPPQLFHNSRTDKGGCVEETIDLAGYTKSTRRSKRQGSKLSNDSVFARGWKKFSEDFPLRSLPPFAEESLRRLDLLGHPKSPQRRVQREGSGTHSSGASTPLHGSPAPFTRVATTVVHRRKTSASPRGDGPLSPLVPPTISLAEIATCRKHAHQNTRSSATPRVYPTVTSIEFVSIANSPALEALELEVDFLNHMVYQFLLLSTSLFMSRNARELAPQVLRWFKPALVLSDAQHVAAMLSLSSNDQRSAVETSPDPSKLRFQQVLLDDMPCTSMEVWLRAAAGAESPNSPTSGDALEEAAYSFAVTAQRFVQICGHASASSQFKEEAAITVLPPVVAAVIFAGAIQCVYFSIDQQCTTTVKEEDVQSMLSHLQQSLGIDDSLVPYCRLHGLILALRTLLGGTVHLEARGEAIHTNFFTVMADLLPYLDTKGLEDAPIAEFTLYKVYVLQEIVDSTLGLMELFDSITNDSLALALCQAFCASCTVLPPLFLSVHIRCNGVPLACGRAVDSALMELLSHYVGGAVLKELGDPDQWLDPSEAVEVAVAHVDAACMRPSPFLRVWSEYLPQAEALVVPMLVQVVSYIFWLYWGRCANEELSAALPKQFMEGVRTLYFRVASKLPEDVRTFVGLLDLIRDAVDASLAWLLPLYERHVNLSAETINAVIASNATSTSWGVDAEETDKALRWLFDCLEDAMLPLHFAIGTNLECIFQRFLVAAVSGIGRTAQQMCGPFVLPSIEDQERESPEMFRGAALPTAAASAGAPQNSAPLSTLAYYPLDIGVCKQHLIRATKLKHQLQNVSPPDVLSRMKYLHWLRRDLETFIETFYVSVWNASIFRKAFRMVVASPHRSQTVAGSTSSQSSADDIKESMKAPTIAVLASLVEEALHNINRFYGNLAEALALRVVHYGSLNHDVHDKLLKLDIRFYRAHKNDKRLLASEGKNAHMHLLYPQYTMDNVLDGVERELHAFVRHSPSAECIVRISSFIYAHLISLYTFLVLDGGDERWFYPEQSTLLLADVELMESFLTKNIPDCGNDRRGREETLWEHITVKDALESSKWWDGGNAVARTLRSILVQVFPVSSDELVNGSAEGGIPPFHTLSENSVDSPFCRYIVRRVLCHRKDQIAKKFVKNLPA